MNHRLSTVKANHSLSQNDRSLYTQFTCDIHVKFFLLFLENEMFISMLTVHCDQNDNYVIAVNGYQARKVSEIRKVIFGL